MTDYRTGPPDDESRPLAQGKPASAAESHDPTTTKSHPTTQRDGFPADTVTCAWRRRRASQRLPVLDCGHSDPWQPWRPEVLSHMQTQAAVAASEHLLAENLLPIFDTSTLRAMWKAVYHRLADDLRREVA